MAAGYHSGLRPQAFFDQLDSSVVTVFYDSVCNIPLFQAPVGRTFGEASLALLEPSPAHVCRAER